MNFSQKSVTRTLALGLLIGGIIAGPVQAAPHSDYDLNSPATVGQVLPNDWHISPAGTQVTLGNLPTNGVISPNGRFLAVTNNGCSPKTQEISIVDLKVNKKIDSVQVPSSFLGIAFSRNGDKLYVSGGNDNKVYVFSFNDGKLTQNGSISVPNYPAGMALLADGTLAVAENLGDQIALIDTATAQITKEIPVGRYPYWVTPAPDGTTLYVSNWGSDSISQVDLLSGTATRQINVGKLPEMMALAANGNTLYVANTNSDSVSVIDTASAQVTKTFDLHFKGLPSGAAPTGLALTPDNSRLFVSLAGANADAVVDTNSGTVQGYIPTGWYPTQVLYNAALKQVVTLNGKGLGLGPNLDGPKPGTNAPNQSQYDYSMITGTASILADPAPGQLAALTGQVLGNALDNASKDAAGQFGGNNPVPRYAGGASPIKHIFFIVRENRTYDQILGDLSQANGDPDLVLFGRDITPNAHALAEKFVTMDNYYADAEVSVQGHAWTAGAYSNDYVEKNTPLLYSDRYPHYDGGVVPISYPPNGYIWKKLADNHLSFRIYGENYYLHSGLYYVLTNVLGLNDPLTVDYYQFLRRTDGRNGTGVMGKFFDLFKPYSDLQSPEALKKLLAGDANLRNNLSTVLTGSTALAERMVQNQQLLDAVAEYLSHYQFNYRGWDLKYSDLDRASAFNHELDRELAAGTVPVFNYIWLPNDHTAGLKPGFLTPKELVAQNDQALGEIVQKISQSPIWKDSAIFVTEDDAQNGSDHVDAHRTVGLVISPYVKHGTVNHTHYDQASMLRTMELILGLKPMSMYDAAALPMYDIFTGKPDRQFYAAAQENAGNPDLKKYHSLQKMTGLSANLDFSRADEESQDNILNKILWESIKGTPYQQTTSEDDD
ncbi:phosphoesterase [Lucifera butyrica]|uniref:Phosphoesterase n=1 Tax=Lucifera butyrica TaxID=1351585 RepID=A0A498R512_9FIRM|nr:bifunctional YncE family protein/alkaline phosphatase family protein [Lucifera butyrica]VBB05900.1 phosphoesterase [Lucifera butyrica]